MTNDETRLSRFSIEPILGGDGKPTAVLPKDLTELDLNGLAELADPEQRVLNRFWLAALLGASPDWLRKRYNVLKRKPNEYIRVTAEQVANQRNHLYSKLFYELAPAGAAVLREHRNLHINRRSPLRLLEHASMHAEIAASWKLGFTASETHSRISWADILANPKTPSHVRDTGNHHITVKYRFDGHPTEKDYIADGPPHGIRLPNKLAYFVLKEIDCDTESIRSNSDAYASIKRKVLQQTAILEQELFRSLLGLPNIYFLYYAPSVERLTSIMDVVHEFTAHRPQLRKNFGFMKHLIYTQPGYDKLQPCAFAFTKDYERVGYDPINFSK